LQDLLKAIKEKWGLGWSLLLHQPDNRAITDTRVTGIDSSLQLSYRTDITKVSDKRKK